VSEVVREGLRLLEDREARRQRVLEGDRPVVDDGIESGPAGPLDLDAIVAEAETARAPRLMARILRTDRGTEDPVEIFTETAPSTRPWRCSPTIRDSGPVAPAPRRASLPLRPVPDLLPALAARDGIDLLRVRPTARDWLAALDPGDS
jgi:hypothetical protein